MPLAFFVIFGGALLIYMGWKNESFQGLLNDTLSPISSTTQSESDFAAPASVAGAAGSFPGLATSGLVHGAGTVTPGNLSSYFQGWKIGRTDQGVDISNSPGAPLPAIGTSKVIGVIPNWFDGEPFVWLQALDGPLKGRYYYYAEQLTNIAPVGSVLQNGATVANYAGSGTGVEAGLATASGSTLARATTGYTEGQVTPAGTLFKQLLGL